MDEPSEGYMREDKKFKNAVSSKFNMHHINFDDSEASQRSDEPNIFLGRRMDNQSPMSTNKPIPQVQNIPSISMSAPSSMQQLNLHRQNSLPPAKRIDHEIDEIVIFEQENQVAQAEAEDEPNTSLSLIETIQLHMGEHLFTNTYPMQKNIYINNNNEEQNEINKKEYQSKNNLAENQMIFYNNSLKVSPLLFINVLLLRSLFTYAYIYAWTAVIILQIVAENNFLGRPIQYGSSTTLNIILIIIAVIIQLISDIIILRKRRDWKQNTNLYQVYHHNGQMAEWVNFHAQEICPGHVFKVLPGESFPADGVILHADRSLVHIIQNHLISQLVEYPSEYMLKQTLIKSQNILLPLSGILSYEISSPEYSDFQIVGKLNLQEPIQMSHSVSMNNICLKGSINGSDIELIVLAMETGIDSLLLKNLQYPFQHKKSSVYTNFYKSKKISDQISDQIREKEGSLIGTPLQKKLESTVSLFLFIYLTINGLGILVGYLYTATHSNEFYLTQGMIQIWKITIYHLTNFIIFIPVLLIPIYKLFLAISGGLTESNISKRSIQLMAEKQNNIKVAFSQSANSMHKQELLDNKKIIFPIKIRDYNILPELAQIDTIVTTIDTFRDESAFTLHSVKVRELSHNFMTNSIDNELYSTEDVQLIRYFMSVALLTVSKSDRDSSFHYQSGIQLAAKKYLDLKKNTNAEGETLVNGGQFKVKHIFDVLPVHEYPYKFSFMQPVSQESGEDPKILTLVRGNPKLILDKTYGKQIKLTQQSRRLEQQKGFHVQLIAKTTLYLSEVIQIQKAYTSKTTNQSIFYKHLQNYLTKLQPMGLLVFTNQFYQKKIGQSLRNPVLNKSLLNQYRPERQPSYLNDIFNSQHLPNIIILAPNSKSIHPEYEAIHTITNLLVNPCLFNYSLAEVPDKILHEKPTNLQKMINQLEQQKILVWNGWDQKDITYTIDIMNRYGKKILFYTQKDEYMYLMKAADCSIKGSQNGYDAVKYSDIALSSKSSISYLYLTQMIRYDSMLVRLGILSLIFTQISKFVFYIIIEIINIFYTRGTGLLIIKSPLFMVVELVLILDVFYYLNWKDQIRADTYDKKDGFLRQLFLKISHTIIQAVFITFICFYSLQAPTESSGTSQSYHFTYFAIVYTFLHVLILEKIFNYLSYSISIYRIIVILAQILCLYIGFLIVSVTDTYHYYGILWSALKGKVLMTAVGCIWISLTLPAIRCLLNLMDSRNVRREARVKKSK